MWESEEDVQNFLDKFVKYNPDLQNVIKDTSEPYMEICFGTARALRYFIAEGEGIWANLDEVKNSLNEKNIIVGTTTSTNQSHSFTLLPYKDDVIVVQSLGGLYRAWVQRIPKDQIMNLLQRIPSGDTRRLFGFMDVRGDHVHVDYQIFRRKNLNPDLISSSFPSRITEERKTYISRFHLASPNDLRDVGLVLFRPQDALEGLRAADL